MVRAVHFFHISKQSAFPQTVDFVAGHVIQAQYNILRWHDNWLAIGWRKHVVRSQHQRARFHLRFQAQWHVNRHLVAVKVGVKRGTHQGVQLNGFAFNQNRLKRLNAQTVQSRCTVQQNGVFANHFFQDVPYFGHFLFYQFFGRLHGGGQFALFQFVENKRFEQFQRHFFRQTALVQTQVRTNGNHGTTRIVHPFTQQVLTEATALTFNHIGKRFQRTFIRACHRFATATVVQQAVHRFLQHTFFVANDDVGRAQFQQAFQTVVAVNHAAIQIVQIGSGKTSAVQWHEWAQIGRQHGQHVHNHPFQLHAAALERFQHF